MLWYLRYDAAMSKPPWRLSSHQVEAFTQPRQTCSPECCGGDCGLSSDQNLTPHANCTYQYKRSIRLIRWNISSTSIGLIATDLRSNVHGSHTEQLNYFGDLLTFPRAVFWSWHLLFWMKYIDDVKMDWHERSYIHDPQRMNPTEFGDSATFDFVPSLGQKLLILQNSVSAY